MLNILELGYVVDSIAIIPDYGDNSELNDTYLFVLSLNNGWEDKVFRLLCNHNVLKLNITDYINTVITEVVYDALNNELQITFDNNLGLCFDEINMDSIIMLNNK